MTQKIYSASAKNIALNICNFEILTSSITYFVSAIQTISINYPNLLKSFTDRATHLPLGRTEFCEMWHNTSFLLLHLEIAKLKRSRLESPRPRFRLFAAVSPKWRATFTALHLCKNQRKVRIQHREVRALSSVCHNITQYGWKDPLGSTKLNLF